MTAQEKPKDKGLKDFLFEILFGLAPVILIVCALIWDQSIGLTLLLLLGAWIINTLLKKGFGHSVKALFADLSFASFIFVCTRKLPLPGATALNVQGGNPILPPALMVLILAVFWLVNLKICGGIGDEFVDYPSSHRSNLDIFIFSLLLGLGSVASAIIA